MALIASLDAYDWPEVRPDVDRFWRDVSIHLRRHGVDAPRRLWRGRSGTVLWQRADVLLAQTCSLPYRTGQHRGFAVLGALNFDIPDCATGSYCSRIIARPGFRWNPPGSGDRTTIAVNSRKSQSGWAALMAWLESAYGTAGTDDDHLRVAITGSHRASVAAIAAGEADLAAIDAVSWHLARRFEPAAKHVHPIASTPVTPGLPLVTARQHSALLPRLRDALSRAAQSARRRPSADLPIIGFAPATDRLYRLDPNAPLGEI